MLKRTGSKPVKKPAETTTVQPSDSKLSMAEAARFLSTSKPSITRLSQRGILHPIVDEHGQHWYLMSELEKARESGAFSTQDITVELVAKQNDFLEIVTDQTRRSFEPHAKATDSIVGFYQVETERLRKRVDELEGKLIDMLRVQEELLSEAHARSMVEKELENNQELKRGALDIVKKIAPTIAGQVMQGITGRQPSALGQFFASIKPEQIKVLLMSGLLDDEQTRLFKAVLIEAGVNLDEPQPEATNPTS